VAIAFRRAGSYIASVLKQNGMSELASRLKPKIGSLPPTVPFHSEITPDAVAGRWNVLNTAAGIREQLFDELTISQMEQYQHHIENFIGTAKIPVGVAGPLRVNGLFAQGDFYVPLATTEVTLVASYSRGAELINEVGGASAMLLSEGVSRSPVFSFTKFEDLGVFIKWATEHEVEIRQVAEATTHFGKLEVDCCTGGIDGSVEVTPTALDSNICLVNPPGFVRRLEMTAHRCSNSGP